MTVDIIIEDARWDQLGLADLAQTAAQAALGYFALDPACFSISALGGNDARIAELNASFRGNAAATNVLSWPSLERAAPHPGGRPLLPRAEETSELGDIALAYETCHREAALAERLLSDHVLHLFVHGILHLLGYDHLNDQDAMLMESIEIEILKVLGVGNPYNDRGDMLGILER
jgi:probable rRNA maturation factor